MYTIYKVKNKINDKIYIGFSKSFEQRIKYHKYFSLTKKSNFAFHKAIRKHGWDNFSWEIIYESWDKEHCSEIMEPFFIKEYNSFGKYGYNMTIGGGGAKELKRSPLTEEQKNTISEKTKIGMENMSEEDKEKMLFITTNPTEKTKLKMSEAKKGKESTFKGKSQPESAKLKISISSKKSWENEEIRNKILKHIQNPTEETRKKMSDAKLGKPTWNKGIKNWQTEETFEKKRITMEKKKEDGWVNPKKGTECSEESKKKMRNKGSSIEILDMNMNRVGILNGNYEMKEKGFNPSCVHKVISGKYSQYKGYIFRKLLEKQESYLDITVV